MEREEKNKIKELEKTIYRALNSKNSHNKLYLGKIAPKVAKQIEKLIGFSVENRVHILVDNDIRHMYNNHSNFQNKIKKDQIALTIFNLINIPEIILKPTKIIKGNNQKGNVTIRYIKKYNHHFTYIVEVVPIKSKYLIIKTMWKISSASVHALNQNLTFHHTSQTKSKQNISTSINNISQLNNKCNEPLKEEELKP